MIAKPEKNYQKFTILLCLYIAQSIPLSFFTTVVPVIMRQENYSLESIGLLQLVKLPWIIKFLWAPLVDKTSVNIKGYSRWIIYSELFYALVIVAVGFLSLQTDFMLIAVLVIIAITASATQDIATDALAILVLKKDERSMGNSMQSMGSFIGSLIGSGVLLLVYRYLGWQALLFGLAVFVLIALIPLRLSKFKQAETNNSIKKSSVRFSDIYKFFTQKGIWKQVIFLNLFYSGIMGILTMLKPYLVDLKYSVEEIGFMSGIVGTLMAVCCAFFAGWFVKKIGLRKGTISFCVMMLITAGYFFWISMNNPDTVMLYLGTILLWSSYGMATIIVYTTSMNCVRKGYEGTDFTIQTVLAQLGSLIIAAVSGKLAGAFGYKGLFAIEIAMAIITLLYISLIYTRNNNALA